MKNRNAFKQTVNKNRKERNMQMLAKKVVIDPKKETPETLRRIKRALYGPRDKTMGLRFSEVFVRVWRMAAEELKAGITDFTEDALFEKAERELGADWVEQALKKVERELEKETKESEKK